MQDAMGSTAFRLTSNTWTIHTGKDSLFEFKFGIVRVRSFVSLMVVFGVCESSSSRPLQCLSWILDCIEVRVLNGLVSSWTKHASSEFHHVVLFGD